MGGEGFEPSKALPADLQSVPFGHSGIHPYVMQKFCPDNVILYHMAYPLASIISIFYPMFFNTTEECAGSEIFK